MNHKIPQSRYQQGKKGIKTYKIQRKENKKNFVHISDQIKTTRTSDIGCLYLIIPAKLPSKA